MAAANNRVPFMNQEDAAFISHICNHRYQAVNPGDVQHGPYYNDETAVTTPVYGSPLATHDAGVMTNEVVNGALPLTYNAGDRTWFEHNGPQDHERRGVLDMDPIVNFVRDHAVHDGFDDGNHRGNMEFKGQLMYQSPGRGFKPSMFDQFMEQSNEMAFFGFNEYTTSEPANNDTQILYAWQSPHASSPPQRNPHTCPQCGSMRCKTADSLKRHMDRQHGSTSPTYLCHYVGCDYSSKKPTDVQRHIDSTHLKLSLYECPGCQRPFPRKDNCKRHIEKCKKIYKGVVASSSDDSCSI